MAQSALQRRGGAFETRAASFLSDQGLTIIARGYRCRLGELDIVARDTAGLVIVEVRARSSFSDAVATVGPAKRRRIINATRHFLMKHPQWFSGGIRFDVIGFDRIDSDAPELRWIKNAFDAS